MHSGTRGLPTPRFTPLKTTPHASMNGAIFTREVVPLALKRGQSYSVIQTTLRTTVVGHVRVPVPLNKTQRCNPQTQLGMVPQEAKPVWISSAIVLKGHGILGMRASPSTAVFSAVLPTGHRITCGLGPCRPVVQ